MTTRAANRQPTSWRDIPGVDGMHDSSVPSGPLFTAKLCFQSGKTMGEVTAAVKEATEKEVVPSDPISSLAHHRHARY